jgi:outer membrane protein assembly factor BamB
LWTAQVINSSFNPVVESPAVVTGVVYVAGGGFVSPPGAFFGTLDAFDAAGTTNCSGSPKTCTPLWSDFVTRPVGIPAVANGVVYVGAQDGNLHAYDAASGQELWTAPGAGISIPAVANGVVYVGSGGRGNLLYAFDADGNTNCSRSPKTCAPLWTGSARGRTLTSAPVLANGMLYIGTDASSLDAFGLEKIPPTTSVVIPSNGATVSGTTLLDASASDDVSVSRVEFHLGSGGSERVIGVATPSQYGWIYNWDTTSVPNGNYTLESVAYDPAGNHAESAVINITVQN